MQIVYLCIHRLTEAYKALLKYPINIFTPQDVMFCFVVCMHYVSCIIYHKLCNMQYHHACMHYELMLLVLWTVKFIVSDFFCFQKWPQDPPLGPPSTLAEIFRRTCLGGRGKIVWQFFWSIFSPNQRILSTFRFFQKKP